MTMKVQILSEEMIKPSSPTPHHLRVLKLSLLEQLAPLEYVPVIYFFYPPNCTTAKAAGATGRRSDRLKKSLSETLTRFYPLAGRIKDHISIECNDEGVLYVEAQVNCHLVEFLRDPDLKLLNHYLPFDMNRTSVDVQLGFQVNNFDCGGMALGVCLLHKIVDLAALTTFVNAWAATTARAPNYEVAVAQSSFISASLFPPIDSLAGFVLNTPKLNFIGNFITRRYVFDESIIKALKLKASINGGGFYDKPPTTVEVITALIWRSAMAASRARHGTRRASVMAHAVNLRGRMAEPLPQHSMGSIITLATAYYSKSTGSDEKEELQGLVRLVREATRKINSEYIRKVRGENEDDLLMLWKSFQKEAELLNDGSVDCYWFSSWYGFPLCEADFGWGKPVWMSSVSYPKKNFVILIEAKGRGGGREAWVTLDELEMAFFDKDQDLQAFSQQKPCSLVAARL